MKNGKLFFKNTHEENKQIEMAVDAKEAPDEFFFVHIKFKTEAFTYVSMLQTSCVIFIRQCHKQGLITNLKKEMLEKYIMQVGVNKELRSLLGTLLLSNLQETISRVRLNLKSE